MTDHICTFCNQPATHQYGDIDWLCDNCHEQMKEYTESLETKETDIDINE